MISAVVLIFLMIETVISGHPVGKDKRESLEVEYPPFIQTESEIWSFNKQMKRVIKDYLNTVQEKSIHLLRNHHLQRAKMPDFNESLSLKEPNNDSLWKIDLNLSNSWVEPLTSLVIVPDFLFRYEKMDLIVDAYVITWERLRLVQDFAFNSGNDSIGGNVEGRASNVNYSLSFALNFDTKNVTFKQFRLGCVGDINVEVKGLKQSLSWISDHISRVALKIYKIPILEDIVSIIGTTFQEVVNNLDISQKLPKIDYSKKYNRVKLNNKGKKLIICKPNGVAAASNFRKDSKPLSKNGYLPFIQNEAEMWSFEHQLKDRVNDFVDHLIYYSVQHFIERELDPTKLPSFVQQFNSEEQKGTKRYGEVILSNGWLLNLFKMASRGVHQVELNKKEVVISSYVHIFENLTDPRKGLLVTDLQRQKSLAPEEHLKPKAPIPFDYDFNANIKKTYLPGSIKGTAASVTFLLKILVDLNKMSTTVKDFHLYCVGSIDSEVKSLNAEFSWIENGISKTVMDLFKGPIFESLEMVLRNVFEYTASKTEVDKYMPRWSYSKNYEGRVKDGTINGNQSINSCNATFISKVAGKRTHQDDHTEIKSTIVPFLNTNMEIWYFKEQLRDKMNKLMNQIIHDTVANILTRDLRRAKMLEQSITIDVKDTTSVMRTGRLILKNGWVEDLSSIGDGGIDFLTYNKKDIVFTSHLQIWWNLHFMNDFTFNVSKPIAKGNIDGEIHSVIYFFKIRINFMDPHKVVLEKLQLKCVGDISIDVQGLSQNQKWMRNSISSGTVKIYKKLVIKEITDIFRRSLEDSIAGMNVSQFIPEWNFKKNYSNNSTDKFRTEFPLCVNMENVTLGIESGIKNGSTYGFEDFLPKIQTFALRNSLQQTIEDSIKKYLNEVWWNGARQHVINRYAEPKLGEYTKIFRTMDGQSNNTQLLLTLYNGSNSGLTSANKLEIVDMTFGENDSIHVLLMQKMSSLEVRFPFNLTQDDKGHTGFFEGRVDNVTNLIKCHFFLESKRLIIEDYDLYCVEGTRMEAHGLEGEYAWLNDSVLKEAVGVFSHEIINDLWTLMQDILDDAISRDAIKYYIPKWISEEQLYEIATQIESKMVELKNHSMECSPWENGVAELPYKGGLPYILTETEWWTYYTQMQNKMHGYRRNLWSLSSNFLVSNKFGKMKLPNISRTVSSMNKSGLKVNAIVNLEQGLIEDISNIDQEVGENIEYIGTDIILTSQIKFKQKIEFHHHFVATFQNLTLNGTTRGIASSLTYEFKERIYLKSKTVKLEDIHLLCIGNLKTEVEGIASEYAWFEDSVTKLAIEEFLGSNLNDVEKILRIAFHNSVSVIDIRLYKYLPDWNYRIIHGTKQDLAEDEIKKCEPPS